MHLSSFAKRFQTTGNNWPKVDMSLHCWVQHGATSEHICTCICPQPGENAHHNVGFIGQHRVLMANTVSQHIVANVESQQASAIHSSSIQKLWSRNSASSGGIQAKISWVFLHAYDVQPQLYGYLSPSEKDGQLQILADCSSTSINNNNNIINNSISYCIVFTYICNLCNLQRLAVIEHRSHPSQPHELR